MHTCPECGKVMATIGGLEIHMEMQHAPTPSKAGLDPEPIAELERAPVPPSARPSSPARRRYDPTVPLTALLVLALLIVGVGAAVHRATNPSPAASLTSAATAVGGGTTPSTTASVPDQAPAPSASSPGGSPAAIPPAGSESPATAQPAGECQQLAASLSSRPSQRNVDIGQLVRTNAFPPLPLAGFQHPQITDVGHYATLQEYLADRDPNDPTDAQWQQLLVENGFVGADYVEFENGDSSYGAFVFQFATANGARAFNRGTLIAECDVGELRNARAVPALTGGVTYLISDGPPFRATFVAGDTVVRLHICHCVQAPDDQALAGQWAQAVASSVGAG